MKKTVKQVLSFLLTLCLVFTLLPVSASAASVYNAEKALSYAASHWNDGKGLCAEFVSNCLKAGGLSSWNRECTNLYNQLVKEVVNGAKIASIQYLNTSGNYIKVADNQGKISAGDVIFWLCDGCPRDRVGGPYQHTAIVSDVSGTYVNVYQHNKASNNKAAWVGTCYECGRRYSHMVAIHFGAPITPTLSIALLQEGDYMISPSDYGDYALDVAGGSFNAKTDIWLYHKNNTDAQVFSVVHVGEGWIKIVPRKNPQMCIKVVNGDSKNGARLWLGPDDGTDSCYFRTIDCGDGTYKLQNKSNQRILDLSNNVAYDGAVVQLWDLHDTPAGRWRFTPAIAPSSVVVMAEGDYVISPAGNNGYALEPAGSYCEAQAYIWLYHKYNTDAQVFSVVHVGEGWIKMVSRKNPQMCIKIVNGDSKNGARLWLGPDDGTDSCYFRTIDCGDGTYRLQTKIGPNQRILDLSNNVANDWAVVQLWDLHNLPAGRWRFTPAIASSSIVEIAEGDYVISPSAHSDYALEPAGSNCEAHAYIWLYHKYNTDAQVFSVVHVGEGWIKMVSRKNPQMCIKIVNGDSKNGARLWLGPDDGTDSCYFRAIDCGDGTYRLQTKIGPNQRILDLSNNIANDWAVVQLWDLHNLPAGRWRFTPAGSSTSPRTR